MSVARLPTPEAVPECAACQGFSRWLASSEPETSVWSDIRVLWRRHHAQDHPATPIPEPQP